MRVRTIHPCTGRDSYLNYTFTGDINKTKGNCPNENLLKSILPGYKIRSLEFCLKLFYLASRG
jgi:hypothetical protein